MARKPKKWPDYALSSLENSLMHLRSIEQLSRQAQIAAKNGDRLEAVIINGDIRLRAQSAIHLLVQAKTGEYDQECFNP